MKTKILLTTLIIFLVITTVTFAGSKEDTKKIQNYEQKIFAQAFEKSLLLKGFDAYVKVDGRTLEVKWNGVSRPFVYQFASSKDTLDRLLKHGFLVVLFYNEFGDNWMILTPNGDVEYFSTK